MELFGFLAFFPGLGGLKERGLVHCPGSHREHRDMFAT